MKQAIINALNREILLADISDSDKLNLLRSLHLGSKLPRDNGFRITTQPTAIAFKRQIEGLVKDGILELDTE
jgi:hypothetical protein